MIALSLAEFSSKRRGVSDRSISSLTPIVQDVLDHYSGRTDWWRPLLTPVHDLFNEVLTDDSGGDVRSDVRAWTRLADTIATTVAKTNEPTKMTAKVLATWLSTAAINAAATAAAARDTEPLLLTWVTMHDGNVRPEHAKVDGQERPPGESFDIEGTKTPYPGFPVGPIELWINCRCMVRPMLASHTAKTEGPVIMAADTDSTPETGRVIVALPARDHAVHGIGDVEKHMSLIWLGNADENSALDMAAVKGEAAHMANAIPPFEVPVDSIEPLGVDGATVWMLGSWAEQVQMDLLHNEVIEAGYNAVKQHVGFKPHVTINYGQDVPPEASDVTSVMFDRLALWDGETRTEFPLGGVMADDDKSVATEPDDVALTEPLAWHGVLAPEGVWSGDKRRFIEGSLRNRDLPLPLTWQKVSSEGHDQATTVAKIEAIARVGNELRATGHWLSIPESDEMVGLLADFGRYGVSIDADDAEFDFDEDTGGMSFTSARIASACIVSIPAFAEAFVAMGDGPPDFMPPTECDPSDPDYEECLAKQADAAPEKVPASAEVVESFGRGPGWLTDPEDTRRIHDYWTKPGQPGYVEINWGVPGDFNRCRALVGEKIAKNSPDKVRFLNQICSQWHHDATGAWPGQAPAEKATKAAVEGETVAPALTLVATVGTVADATWFANPNLTELTPLTVTEDGRVFGHLAGWKSCHAGYPGTCVAPPHSASGYAHFLTGAVRTDQGLVPVGRISLGGGHASHGLRPNAALSHYDATSTVVAQVTCGEDDHGIWLAGRIAPGTPPEKVDMLLASPISGDWRKYAGEYDLIAALAVNAPGYLVPRVGITNGEQVSLVAAGVVQPHQMLGGEMDWESIAAKVEATIAKRAERRARMRELRTKVSVND